MDRPGPPGPSRPTLWMFGAALCLGALPALAGPNAGGTLVLHDPDLIYTSDVRDYAGAGTSPVSCWATDARLDGSRADQPKVWKVYAMFLPGSSPRLKALSFGVHYSPDDLIVSASGACTGDRENGAAEMPQDGWPGNDTGTAIVFQYVQTGQIVECYWFAGYDYAGKPTRFQVRDHPEADLGGNFADDAIPSELDMISAYGSLGFETAGRCPCVPGGAGDDGKDHGGELSKPAQTR